MRHAPALAALLVLVAGCATPADDGDEPALVADRFAMQTPEALGPGASGETFVAIDGEHTLVCGHGTFTAATPLWVERDGAWAMQEHGAVVPAGDCDVDVAPDGTWGVLDVWLEGLSLSQSQDQGATWQLTPNIALPLSGTVDRPWLVYTDDRIIVTYQGAPQVPVHRILVTSSGDGGETWTTPSVLVESSRVIHNYDLAVGPDGVVRTGIMEYDADDESALPSRVVDFQVAASADGGQSWEFEPVASGVASDVIVAPSVGPRGAWAYVERTLDGDLLWLLTEEADGWQRTGPLAEGGRIYTPAVDVRADGAITVAWMREDVDPGLHVTRIHDGVHTVLAHEGPGFQFIEYLDVMHDAAGRAVVAYSWDDPDTDCLHPRHAGGVFKFCAYVVRESLSL